VIEPVAAFGGREPFAIADEQRFSDPFLELVYAFADSSLRDVEFGSATREAPDAMGGLKENEQIQRRKGGPVSLHNHRLLGRRNFFNVFGTALWMHFRCRAEALS
jgi:hypothetical protein